MMMTKTDDFINVFFICVMCLLFAVLIQLLNQNGELSAIEREKLEAGEIVQVTPWQKYGDDVKPKQSAVFCRVLPFKRHAGDDQVYCWTEIIE